MRKAIVITPFVVALAGCRNPGLPPEPPEHDAANPEAGLVEAEPPGSTLTRSAFEGVDLEGGGGHEHHHHHQGHGAKAPAEAGAKAPAKAKETKADEEQSHEGHQGHGGHEGHGGRS